jgi:hypothetical protein
LLVEHAFKIDVQNFAQLTAVSLTRCEQRHCLLRNGGVHAPFFSARDDHRRVIGAWFLFGPGGHVFFFPAACKRIYESARRFPSMPAGVNHGRLVRPACEVHDRSRELRTSHRGRLDWIREVLITVADEPSMRAKSQAYIRSQAHAGWSLIRSKYDDGGFSGATPIGFLCRSSSTTSPQARLPPSSSTRSNCQRTGRTRHCPRTWSNCSNTHRRRARERVSRVRRPMDVIISALCFTAAAADQSPVRQGKKTTLIPKSSAATQVKDLVRRSGSSEGPPPCTSGSGPSDLGEGSRSGQTTKHLRAEYGRVCGRPSAKSWPSRCKSWKCLGPVRRRRAAAVLLHWV